MMLLGYVVIGLLIYHFYNNGKVAISDKRTAEQLLIERFVNGEIDEKKYLQMKETIK